MSKRLNISENIEKELEKYETTSDKIRYLNAKGFSRGAISTLLGKRYQHVRNVLTQDAISGKTFEIKK